MFKEKLLGPKSTVYDEDGPCTILERDASFEGKLTFDGTVQIAGHFKGEIFSSGVLIITETAVVEARIDVGILQIAGNVRGDIVAKERLEFLAKARVIADITTQALVVEQGAQFQGNCQMGVLQTGSALSSTQSNTVPTYSNPVTMQEVELFQ